MSFRYRSVGIALGLSVAILALAACNGGNPQFAGPHLQMTPSFRAAGPMPSLTKSVRAQRSWMLPSAKSIKKLLYVAGAATSTVYVYDYKTRALVGKLTGFLQPNGECVDAKGDIWITDWQATTTTEYAHGGTAPIATLYTQSEQTACSVDPTTGDLAVGTFTAATIYIFKKARGVPKTYTSSACPSLWGPGYDNKGNLFVEAGINGSGNAIVCWLRHRGKLLNALPFNQKINYGADVMWDGKYITFADQSFGGSELQSGVYQAELNGSGELTLAGRTRLADRCGHSDVLQPFIVGRENTPVNTRQGTVAIGSNNSCLTNVDFWAYPAGGNPTDVLTAPDKVTFGSVVSIKS